LIAQQSFHAQKESQVGIAPSLTLNPDMGIYAISLECRMDQPVVQTG
jgi:hypothetical protein